MADERVPPSPEGRWLEALDLPSLRGKIGGRSLDLAMASRLRYVEGPALSGGAVVAALGEDPREDGARGPDHIRVELRVEAGNGAVIGHCSRCTTAFGPCVHMAVLAVDLAAHAPLREALFERWSVTRVAEQAVRALAARVALDAERKFDGALGAWLSPAAEGRRIEIAADPFDPAVAWMGRAYGDSAGPAQTHTLSVVARPAGERRLLSARELTTPSSFGSRDRRVLEHLKDQRQGRKAAYSTGTAASLTLDAMRVHGGVFVAGFKRLLDFRSAVVRPLVAVVQPNDAVSDLPALSAFWVTDGGDTRVAFADAAFFPGPFPYVWTKAGAIYRVALDVDLDYASQLALAPVLLVPPHKLKDAGARLLRAARGRGLLLPASDVFGLPPVETPRLALRLWGEPLAIEGDLVAVYRAREVSLLVPAAAAATEEGRDLEHEAHAVALVTKVGLVRDASDEDQPRDEGDARRGADEAPISVTGERAVAFWQSGLLALRAASHPPIDVELSARLSRVRVGAPMVARVRVALEGDWLDTRLEFASDELPVELEAIRRALLHKQRWVSLSDGTLTRISAAVESLAEQAAEVMGKDSAARLPAHQLGRLDRWIEENDGRMDAAVEALRRRLRALAVADEPEMPDGLRATLRPYQRLGLSWLQFLQALGAGGILADDMGLGKTITTLAFLLRRKEAEGPAPSLVVCPTSVAGNWVREAERFTPGLTVLLLHGPSKRARAALPIAKHDLVITTYGLLRRDLEALASTRFRCVVLDEAQSIKNADAATTRAAGRLDAGMRLALTGTPMENHLRELWSLMSFVNPGILGTARAFETRYERPIVADRDARRGAVAAELRAIVRPFLLRRTKNDVLRELPPKTEIERMVTPTREAKRMYDALAHELREGLTKDIERRPHITLGVFTALVRLRQMACDPRLVDPRSPPEASAKREAFLDLVRELVAEGRRALVFSQFVQLLTLWRKDLDEEKIGYEYLDGRTTKRDEVVARFQEGTAPLFLISLKAGGAGINLTAADTVIHCDPWWNPAVEDQATDRAHRIGQDKPVTVVRLVAKGTIEEKILSLKAKKRELASAVIGDDARALEGITDAEIRALLGDADEDGDRDGDRSQGGRSPTDELATATRVLSPDFEEVVKMARRWLLETGQPESALASIAEIPPPFAARLARGEPFPCSRAVAERIRERLRAWE